MPDARPPLEEALTRVLGRDVWVQSAHALSGGDINHVERVVTNAGTFVVKSHVAAPPGFFKAEAVGLAALRESGSPLRIPDVIALHDHGSPSMLVLEDLGDGRAGPGFDEAFGRGLATMHRHRAPAFGLSSDNFCGLTPQPNPWTDRWLTFYAESRLGHQLALASAASRLSPGECARVDRLIERLGTWLDEPTGGPSLIHGDLWSGNLHVARDNKPGLIDPAAYFGHREAEFGMMTLFGGFAARVYAAYEEAFPLEPGWRDRNPLYQLYHLLNHLNLFGGSYRAQVLHVLDQLV